MRCYHGSFINGNGASPRPRPIASSGRSNGAPTGSTTRATTARRRATRDRLERWAAAMLAESDRFFALKPCSEYELCGGSADVPERRPHAPSREQHSSRARSSRATSPKGRRRAVVVLPQWNADAEGHVGLCQLLNRFGLSALRLTPALSRRPQAGGTAPRRLHRQRQHRPDGAGVPAGGARRAARDRLAGAAGLRVDRHPRHQPRLVPVDAHGGARAAGQGGRAQSHLAVLRRRRLGRAVDGARPRRARRAHRARAAAAASGCRSRRFPISIGCATSGSCWSTRATT